MEELGYGDVPYTGRSLVATIAVEEKCVYHVPLNRTHSEELEDRWCTKRERYIWMVYNELEKLERCFGARKSRDFKTGVTVMVREPGTGNSRLANQEVISGMILRNNVSTS